MRLRLPCLHFRLFPGLVREREGVLNILVQTGYQTTVWPHDEEGDSRSGFRGGTADTGDAGLQGRRRRGGGRAGSQAMEERRGSCVGRCARGH